MCTPTFRWPNFIIKIPTLMRRTERERGTYIDIFIHPFISTEKDLLKNCFPHFTSILKTQSSYIINYWEYEEKEKDKKKERKKDRFPLARLFLRAKIIYGRALTITDNFKLSCRQVVSNIFLSVTIARFHLNSSWLKHYLPFSFFSFLLFFPFLLRS